MPTIIFTVPGEPVAKGRPRATVRSGHARLFTPEKTVNYESKVALFAKQAMSGAAPLEGPVELSVVATFTTPKTWTKKRLAAHAISPELVIKRPDFDNLLKAVCDGMNGIVFLDDCQVAMLGPCRKVYGAFPGVTIGVISQTNEEVSHGAAL